MSDCEKYPSPQSDLSKIEDAQTATSSDGEPFLEAETSIVTAQFELLGLMGQCVLAWATLPTRLVAAQSPQDEQKQVVSGDGKMIFNQVATISGAAWQAASMITGIEETLNDQFYKPRPHNTEHRGVLALWERSNEFEFIRAPANVRAPESHLQTKI